MEWYSFTLDQPARVTSELKRDPQDSSFQGVLSLFNNDPWDSADPYNVDGHRLLDQVDGKAHGGVATLDQLLSPGTYYLAVSGSGNLDFHPLLAASGLPGSTGSFDLKIDVADAGLGATTGPWVLASDPAAERLAEQLSVRDPDRDERPARSLDDSRRTDGAIDVQPQWNVRRPERRPDLAGQHELLHIGQRAPVDPRGAAGNGLLQGRSHRRQQLWAGLTWPHPMEHLWE